MIVCHEHRFIFVKTRKTAGTSVEIALSQFCGPDDIITEVFSEDEATRRELGFRGPQNETIPFGRYSARKAAGALRRGQRARYYNHMRAADIRRTVGADTWDSYFTFTVERNPFDRAVSRYWWSTRDMEPRPSMSEYLLEIDDAFLCNWPIYMIDGEVAVDRVMRHESLADDFAAVGGQLGLSLALPEKKAKGQLRPDRRGYDEVLDADVRARIEQLCAPEIRTFGYEW